MISDFHWLIKEIPENLRRLLSFAVVFSIASPLLELVGAAAVVVLVLVLQGAPSDACRICDILPFSHQLGGSPLFAVALFVVAVSASQIIRYLLLDISRRLVQGTRRELTLRLVGAYLDLPWLSFVAEGRPTRVKHCTGTANDAASALQTLLTLVSSSVMIGVLAVGALVQTPWITLGLGVVMLVALWIVRRLLYPRIRQISKANDAALRGFHRQIAQVFDASKEISVYRVSGVFLHRMEAPLDDACQAAARLSVIPQIPWLLFDTVLAAAIALAVGVAVLQSGEFNISVLLADLGMILVLYRQFLPALGNLMGALGSLPASLVSLEIIRNELASAPPRRALASPQGDLAPGEILRLDGVGFAYSGASPLFENISLTLRRGDRTAIIGPSGGGKSTLLRLGAGLMGPIRGGVLSGGAWRVAYVPQETALLEDSVLENILFGLEAEDEARVWEALSLVRLDGLVRRMPEGLATRVGDNGVKLSGGQRQRLGIARALYRRPDLLLLDEATSALDRDTERAVMWAIHRAMGDGAVLFVTHRASALEIAGRVYELADGVLRPHQQRGVLQT